MGRKQKYTTEEERVEAIKASRRKAQAKWSAAHPELMATRKKKWADANPERMKAASNRYYNKHREAALAKTKQFVKNHPGYKTKHNHIYLQKSKQARTTRALCNLFVQAIRSKKFSKYVEKLMGCTFKEFEDHITILLETRPGVTFDDYGRGDHQWTLDHVIPYSKFDLTIEEELLKCTNYKNTQPLTLSENASKYNK
jgi:hypothetical protein